MRSRMLPVTGFSRVLRLRGGYILDHGPPLPSEPVLRVLGFQITVDSGKDGVLALGGIGRGGMAEGLDPVPILPRGEVFGVLEAVAVERIRDGDDAGGLLDGDGPLEEQRVWRWVRGPVPVSTIW